MYLLSVCLALGSAQTLIDRQFAYMGNTTTAGHLVPAQPDMKTWGDSTYQDVPFSLLQEVAAKVKIKLSAIGYAKEQFDCEDQAEFAMVMLKLEMKKRMPKFAGTPVFPKIIRTKSGILHAVLSVKTDRGLVEWDPATGDLR